MIGNLFGDEVAYHYCAPCQVESGPDHSICWLCGKAMQPIPKLDENGNYTRAWLHTAMDTEKEE